MTYQLCIVLSVSILSLSTVVTTILSNKKDLETAKLYSRKRR